jgi:phosphohistidine phosphatase
MSVRRLILLRHAKSDWPGGSDHDRPLAARGRRDAPAVGRWLRDAGIIPDLVVCSTARRARETWELAAEQLDRAVPVEYDRRVYDASADDLLDVATEAPTAVRTLLVVGHNPAIQELAVGLAGSADGDSLERAESKFGTSALAVLEVPGSWAKLVPGGARLLQFAKPRGRRPRRDAAPSPTSEQA